MKLNNLHDLFVAELKDLHSAETQLLKALPRMAKAASDDALRQAIEEHITVTEKQRDRIEKICDELDATPRGKKCRAMEGIIEEGEEVLQYDAEPAVLDAAIIAAAQRAEHYEIASYGTARTFANMLGYRDAAELLQQTLDEEVATDETLTDLAESDINSRATETAGAEEAEEED